MIGTGSSAVQSIPLTGEQAGELTIFQRTPTFVHPARNRLLTDDEVDELKGAYPEYRKQARNSGFGVPVETDPRSAIEVPEPERTARYEQRWGESLVSVATAFLDTIVCATGFDAMTGALNTSRTAMMIYAGGLARYRQECATVVANGCEDFTFD